MIVISGMVEQPQVIEETPALVEFLREILTLANELKLMVGVPALVGLLIVWILARYGVFGRVTAALRRKQ